MIYVKTNSLYHHGIKGQKWGVRRFQNKNGSLTPAGRERYDDDGVSSKPKKDLKVPKVKSTHRLNLEKKYKEEGMTKEQAEQAAAKRIRGEQYAIAAAAVTVAACVAYNKYRNYAVDKTISADSEFQRIMRLNVNNSEIREGPQYFTNNKGDKVKYKGILGDALKKDAKNGDRIFDVTVKNKQDLKVASKKRAQDTFMKLYKEDPEFRSTFEKRVKANKLQFMMGPLSGMTEKLSDKQTLSDKELRGKGYDLFNIMLVDKAESGVKNANKFYDALREQGMNAVGDVNDKKYSGYKSKNPIIAFDGAFDYKKRVMEDNEIQQNLKKAKAMIVTPEIVKAGSVYAGMLAATPISNYAAERKRINAYKTKHPNTNMTDKEILEMLTKKNKKK